MPWKTRTAMSLRRELIQMAQNPETNVAELCRRYNVSRKTAYKWIARYNVGGVEALSDRSRRPAHSPSRTAPEVEAAVLRVRARTRFIGRQKDPKSLVERRRPRTVTGYRARLFCAAMVTSARSLNHATTFDSRPRPPTSCGRWTSRATLSYVTATGASH